jgi:tRNA nucleotidyltransferase (CCA-adding enzyme)
LSRVGRLVVVDTCQFARLGDLTAVLNNLGLDIHIYDHHPAATGDITSLVKVIATVGVTVTILTELITSRNLR